MLSPFVSQKLGTFVASENHEDLLVLTELIEAGKVTPVIDRTYPLSEVPEGHPLPRGRPRPRQGRHHRVRPDLSRSGADGDGAGRDLGRVFGRRARWRRRGLVAFDLQVG